MGGGGDGEVVAQRAAGQRHRRAPRLHRRPTRQARGAARGCWRLRGDAEQGPLMQANALGYLRHYPDPRARAALVAALTADHPLLRMVAASSLEGSPSRAGAVAGAGRSAAGGPPLGAGVDRQWRGASAAAGRTAPASRA